MSKCSCRCIPDFARVSTTSIDSWKIWKPTPHYRYRIRDTDKASIFQLQPEAVTARDGAGLRGPEVLKLVRDLKIQPLASR